MGRIQNLRDRVGLTDKKLIASGTPARGRVVEVTPTKVVIGIAQKFMVCDVAVDVELDGDRWRAHCKHPIHVREVEAFQRGHQVVVVKVDPADRAHIALDFAADAPPKERKRRFF
jgi:membrane protein implicated in regulation of membrane protease activity